MSREQRLKRKLDRTEARFARHYGSLGRVRFIRSLPCEVTGQCSEAVHNAHTRSRGAGGTYRDIVPLQWLVHRDFDEMSEAKFALIYQRTKQSIRDRAPVYQQLWEGHRGSQE